MPLTKLQLTALKFYIDHRDQPLTLLELVQRSIIHFFLRIVIAAVAAVAFDLLNAPVMGYLVAGIMVGAIARDIGIAWRTTQLWPLLNMVLDWDRVEQRLAEAERQ